MDTSIYTPYFYIIQHIESGKFYAGVRYGKNANPDQLLKFNGYQTSSIFVKQIILEEGLESFVIRKIRVFETAEEALDYETRFLRRVNASFNDNFLNRCNNSMNGVNIDWEKLKKTNVERYGCEFSSQNEEVKEKMKKTCLENLGCEYPMQSEEVRTKSKQSMLEKYGVTHNSQVPEFKEKREQTCLNRFGVKFALQSEEIKEKYKKTCLEKYGHTNVSQNEEVKEKRKQSFLNNFGYDNPSKSPEIKEKKRLTYLSRYGYENIGQAPETKEKQRKIISDLLNQPTIVEIRNYRDRFKLKLGQNWYYKSQEILDGILAELKLSYGEISENI